jgi:Brp/Blh family beta-carotene 15,15'-monooxygenase
MTAKTGDCAAPELHGSAPALRHQSWVLGLAIVACLLGLALPELSIARQFWVVLVPIMIVGLSHGGADPTILSQLARNSEQGVLLATALYVAAAIGFIALIWWLPTLALITFLLLSVWHFGYTDAGFIHTRTTRSLIWLSGSMTILGPMLGHPLQTAELFSWLIGANPASVYELVRLTGPLLGFVWLVTFAIMGYRTWGEISPRALTELALLAGAMVLLPPLLAFAFYFCAVHSLRHFLVLMALREDREAQPSALLFILRLTAPATALAVILALLAWALMTTQEPETSLLTDAVRVMFWALAALTLPHAFAVKLWWRRPEA